MIYKNLNNAILESLKLNNWDSNKINFSVQRVQRKEFGELFTNVALIISNKFNLKIEKVTKKIKDSIDQEKYNFEKITILNGYLNFFHKKVFLNKIIFEILEKKEKFGSLNIGKNIKVNYEWVSGNPTGFLHVGHARNVIVGNVVTNILEFAGYDVKREYYVNDFGLQVYKSAKTVYYHYSKLINQKFEKFEDMYKNPEVKEIAKILFEKFGDDFKNLKWIDNNFNEKEKQFSQKVKDYFWIEIKKDCSDFGIKFDVWFFESNLYKNNKFEKFIEKLDKKKCLYKKDGALWLNAKKFGSKDDFVLIKSNGSTTYFAGDIMYHDDKYQRGFDLIIDLWGSDHFGHFKRIKSGLKALGWDEKKFDVNFLQMVRMVDSKGDIIKFSKRSGNTIFLRDIVKKYGKDFISFMLILKQRSADFVLDLSLLKDKSNKNPLYYVQYAYSRAFQMVKKLDENIIVNNYLQLDSEFEKELILSFYKFKNIIRNSALKQEPQLLTEYLILLSKKFHAFYQNIRISNSGKELKQQRINLVKSFLQITKNVLNLIGILPIKKM